MGLHFEDGDTVIYSVVPQAADSGEGGERGSSLGFVLPSERWSLCTAAGLHAAALGEQGLPPGCGVSLCLGVQGAGGPACTVTLSHTGARGADTLCVRVCSSLFTLSFFFIYYLKSCYLYTEVYTLQYAVYVPSSLSGITASLEQWARTKISVH